MKHKIFFTFLALVTMAFVINAQENDLSATLKQMETLKENVKKLKSHPGNNELREKTIKLVLAMKIAPPIPQEVEILKSKAAFAFKSANKKDDFKAAVKAYKEAVNIAPWVAENYYNLAVAQESAGQPKDAINSYTFYIMAEPNTTKGEAIINKIGELQFAADKQDDDFRKTFAGFSYGISNPSEDFADRSTANLNAGFAKPGYSINIDVYDYKNVLGESNKFLHGFSFQAEFASYAYDLPYSVFLDSKQISHISSNTGNTSGNYYFINTKFGWGVAYRPNKHFTVDMLKVLGGTGMAINTHPTSLDSVSNIGLSLRTTIGSGVRFYLTDKFGISLKVEYSIGSQKYWNDKNIYAIKNPKIGYNTLNYCFGIIF